MTLYHPSLHGNRLIKTANSSPSLGEQTEYTSPAHCSYHPVVKAANCEFQFSPELFPIQWVKAIRKWCGHRCLERRLRALEPLPACSGSGRKFPKGDGQFFVQVQAIDSPKFPHWAGPAPNAWRKEAAPALPPLAQASSGLPKQRGLQACILLDLSLRKWDTVLQGMGGQASLQYWQLREDSGATGTSECNHIPATWRIQGRLSEANNSTRLRLSGPAPAWERVLHLG